MIAVDWGTSSFRAFLLDAAGAVIDHRAAPLGLLACGGRFAEVLGQQLHGWDDELVMMAGMIGSRSGWHEVPYVACPAGLDEIAAGIVALEPQALPGRRVRIVPGVVHRRPGLPAEVMRGEETQILGLAGALGDGGPRVVCLPGTHSKWVRLEAGRIVGLRTAMTGELYGLLRRHSLLAALMPADAALDLDDPAAFARGVEASAGEGGLAHHLFGVRTLGLFAELEPASAASYLSGLLVGHELRGLLGPDLRQVHLVGSDALVARYARALERLGVAAVAHGEASAAHGLYRLGTAAGRTA